jgi:hypothetical protein
MKIKNLTIVKRESEGAMQKSKTLASAVQPSC